MEQLERDSCRFISQSGFTVAKMTPTAFILDQCEVFSYGFVNMRELLVDVVVGAAVMQSIMK